MLTLQMFDATFLGDDNIISQRYKKSMFDDAGPLAGVAGVDHRLEGLGRDPGQVVPGDPPDQLFALPREHGAGDDLQPALLSATVHGKRA